MTIHQSEPNSPRPAPRLLPTDHPLARLTGTFDLVVPAASLRDPGAAVRLAGPGAALTAALRNNDHETVDFLVDHLGAWALAESSLALYLHLLGLAGGHDRLLAPGHTPTDLAPIGAQAAGPATDPLLHPLTDNPCPCAPSLTLHWISRLVTTPEAAPLTEQVTDQTRRDGSLLDRIFVSGVPTYAIVVCTQMAVTIAALRLGVDTTALAGLVRSQVAAAEMAEPSAEGE